MPAETSFRGRVVRGFLWLSAGTFAGQLVSWLSTVFVIRLLRPQDYGLMAMASSFMFLLMTLSELGVGSALVQAEEITERETGQIYGFTVISSLAGWALCWALAPAVALFYHEPLLVAPFRVLAFNIVLTAFYLVPQSLYMREMDFKSKAKIDVAAQIAAALSTLALAVAGKGVWSLILGMTVHHAVKIVLYNTARPHRTRPLFDWRGAGKFIRYGVTLTGSRLLFSSYVLSDTIIMGKFLDRFSVGIYSVALNLASIPAERVLPLINQITFTSYSRIQADRDRVSRSLLLTTRTLAFVAFPLFFGMAAVAPDAIPLLLGQKWLQTVKPFQLLCFVLPLKALSPNVASTLNAVGLAGVTFTNTAITAVVMIASFLIGVRSGIDGVCYAWIIAYSVVFFITIGRSLRALAIPLRRFCGECAFPLAASLLMLGLVELCRPLTAPLPPLARLFLLIALGAAAYLVLSLLLKKEEYREIRRLFLG